MSRNLPVMVFLFIVQSFNSAIASPAGLIKRAAAIKTQTITFVQPKALTFGAADLAPGATSTNNTISITYTSSNRAVATIVNNKVHIIGAGSTTITASQAGNANYSAAIPVSRVLTVNKAPLVISALSKTKIYGAAVPVLAVSYTGFVNGNTAAVLTVQPKITTTASVASAVGNYPITVSGAAAANYTITYAAGTMTVSKAILTITAASKTKIYGAANPVLTASYNGFVNGNTATVLTAQPKVSTTATVASAVGNYPITVSGAAAANYTINYIAGTLSVSKASLIISAVGKTKIYGAAVPALTVNYTGFVNGNTAAVLTAQPKVSTTATVASAAGDYPITVSGAAAVNYAITYTPGVLTVSKATLTIAAENKIKIYGAAIPVLTATYAGFVNGNTATVLTVQPKIITTATTASGVGSYPITASGAAAANYNIIYTPGVLTVNKATLTIAADNKNKVYGSANPVLTFSISGFVNGDTQAKLTTQPIASTTATTSAAIGNYPITVGGAAAANYTFTYVPGVLTITSTTPVISYAGPQTYTVGNAITALTPSNSGGPIPATAYALVTSLAGTGSETGGFANGTGSAASFADIRGIATDATGNIYVADEDNQMIRKVTPAGVVTTFAGSGETGSANGTGTAASFNDPKGIAIDPSGNIYVGQTGDGSIRKITPVGVVTTLSTQLGPKGLATDAAGNIYAADEGVGISKITPDGVVASLYTSVNTGYGIAVDAAGNIYFADNNIIKKRTPAGAIATLAGGASGSVDGTGAAAGFQNLQNFTMDALGNIYTADNTLIKKITPAGVVTTIAGNAGYSPVNGIGTAAQFSYPYGLALDKSGNLYIGDTGNNLIRKINLTGYTVSPALPAGLTLNAATGAITGTPTAPAATAIYTITAYNLYGSSSGNLTITVKASPPPVIAYATPPVYITGVAITALKPTNTGGAVPTGSFAQVNAFAGSGSAGLINGTGSNASFQAPESLTADAAGNIYVADDGNNVIRKITPDGVVSTLAGNGIAGFADGTGTAASFNDPNGVAADAAGNLYVTDTGNGRIRKITPDGTVTTFAGNGSNTSTDGTGLNAGLNSPYGIALDQAGNIYVTELANKIRKITPAGVVTTLAGSGTAGSADGTGTAASFHEPLAVAADRSGNIYVADMGNRLIRKITQAGVVTTFAGSGAAGSADGAGTAATFKAVYGLTTDVAGNIYVADAGSNLIRKITPAGVVTTIAGTGTAGSYNGVGKAASFNILTGLVFNPSGDLYIADLGNNLVRKMNMTGYGIEPALPAGLGINGSGTISGTPTVISPLTAYIITAYNSGGSSSAAVNISVNNGLSPAISYAGPRSYAAGTAIAPLSPANSGGAVPATTYAQVTTFAGSGATGSVNATGTAASFSGPLAVAADAFGNTYVVDENNNLIRKITPAGVVTTLAGSGLMGSANGTGTAASFKHPTGLGIGPSGNIYIADQSNHLVRKITPAGVVTTLAGAGSAGFLNGTGTGASFNDPTTIAVDRQENVYVTDLLNHAIRKITPEGVVTTFAGNGTAGTANGTGPAARFNYPTGITLAPDGNFYLADQNNHLIRKITPAGVVSTLAGSGIPGSADGAGLSASFKNPYAVAADGTANLYVADYNNNEIRKITPDGVVSTIAGSTTAGSANGTGAASGFNHPGGLTLDNAGNLYVADYYNNKIRKIIVTGYTISPELPSGLTFNSTNGIISGTPTVANAATIYTITAYNKGGSSTATLTITITGPSIHSINTANSFQAASVDLNSTSTADQLLAKPAISPNGDGVNDVFVIDGISKYPDNKLMVMNRNGKKVYEASGYDNVTRVFDGHSNINGSMQTNGTYFYVLEYRDKGALKTRSGYLLIKY